MSLAVVNLGKVEVEGWDSVELRAGVGGGGGEMRCQRYTAFFFFLYSGFVLGRCHSDEGLEPSFNVRHGGV